MSSDDFVRHANELQYELGEWPCLSVRKDQDTMIVHDLETQERWPVWAPKIHHGFGASSMMSLLVFTGDDYYGALSPYAVDGQHFDVDEVAVAQGLAGHLALSMSADRQDGNRIALSWA